MPSRLSLRLAACAAFALLAFSPLPALAICGDGLFDDNEQCDDGNTLDGDCCSSTCQLDDNGAPCTDDGKECTTDVCNGEGSCDHLIQQGAPCQGNGCTLYNFCNSDGFCSSDGTLEDGSSCQNQSLCGGSGTCASGQCLGDPANCDGFGDLCHSAQCDPQQGRCIVTPLPDDTVCDDGGICTDPGACKDGECILPPRDCSSFADACNVGLCNPEVQGGCYSSPKAGSPPCDDTDACTDPGTCLRGTCVTSPTDCSSFADDCNDADCDPEGGCFARPKEDTTPCDDGQGCTVQDQCTGGFCNGAPRDCSNLSDACHVGICNGDTGSCQADLRENGTTCDDGNPCTLNDQCTGGVCAGTPKDCSASGDTCNTGVCNGQTGQCQKSPLETHPACDDGDICTTNDRCEAGTCTGTPLDCSAQDSTCTQGECNPHNGKCRAIAVNNGGECSDGSICTSSDQCVNGTCTGTTKDCSQLNNACHVGTCSESTGQCVSSNRTNGTTCDDGNACTVNDQCTAGVCAGVAKDCSGLTDACNTGSCSANTGQCIATPRTNGTTCSDGNLCTTGDQCTAGVCTGSAKDCSSLTDACNNGTCSASTGQCIAAPKTNGTTCNDADACTTGDQCTSGRCAGAPKDCSSLTNACNTGTCSANTGQCVASPKTNGTTCSDGNLCTTGDQCTSGVCSGAAKDCSQLTDACHNGTCSTSTGQCIAANKTNGTTCNDGNQCTTADQCTGGVCGGSPVDCSNLNDACHVGSCSATSGQCLAVARDNGTTCSDGNLCTTSDHCTDGSCAGSPVDCTAQNGSCTTGTCNRETGLCGGSPLENGTPCNDGNGCTTGDHCTSGVCAGTARDCSGLNDACHVGTCSATNGDCIAIARDNGTECSDGDPCTTADQCTGGACNGTAVDCSGVATECRSGVCNTRTGACETVAVADQTPCNDGAFCTATDACVAGNCIGAGNPCAGNPTCSAGCDEATDSCRTAAGTPCESDGNPCTDDVCDGEGACAGVTNTDPCDDGLFCTTSDRCADGACTGQPSCPPTQACGDTCDEAADACRTCGHPFSNDRCIVNAIFVLQGSLGLRECELCTCDVDSNGTVNVTDALRILRLCTSLPSTLDCPAPGLTTTTIGT